MPGPAFHLHVLDLVIDALAAGSPDDAALADLMKREGAHARLGALGPDLLRYRPVPAAALDTLINTPDLTTLTPDEQKALAQQVVPNPEMAVYGLLYRLLVPKLGDIRDIFALFERLQAIVDAQDLDALKAAKDDLDQLQPRIEALKDLVELSKPLQSGGALAIIGGLPSIQGDNPGVARLWRGFEYLRWTETGAFARALFAEAETRNDGALRAYAYGWMTHVAGSVIGEPFVNSIVAGPYRTHWWRRKYVRNYVDAWVFGRYRTPATMSGDTPNPAYADWASLFNANLQNDVRLDAIEGADAASAAAGGAMPATPGFDAVAAMIAAASAATYGGRPAPLQPADPVADPTALREAYVGILSVLWFMTGDSPLCPQHPGAPPPGHEMPPDWYTDAGSTPPPAPAPGGGGSSAGDATVSGILAIILAVIAILTGNIIVGVGALVAGIAAVINAAEAGDPVDWSELAGHIYWLRMLLFDTVTALRKSLTTSAVFYPLGAELGSPPVDDHQPWMPATDQTQPNGIPLTRNGRSESYPLRVDAQVDAATGTPIRPDLGYLRHPQAATEAPSTLATFEVGVYADRIVDGLGLLNGGMLNDPGTFPTRGTSFGGIVANAVEILRKRASGLPDYNLDGDRGYGWKCWRPRRGTKLNDPAQPVDAVEDP